MQDYNFACGSVWGKILSLDIMEEEHRVRVLENRVLRRLMGPKRDEVIGGCM
jgi:hypothetical protein